MFFIFYLFILLFIIKLLDSSNCSSLVLSVPSSVQRFSNSLNDLPPFPFVSVDRSSLVDWCARSFDGRVVRRGLADSKRVVRERQPAFPVNTDTVHYSAPHRCRIPWPDEPSRQTFAICTVPQTDEQSLCTCAGARAYRTSRARPDIDRVRGG